MARVTQAKRIEQRNEEEALAFFQDVLGELPDPRRAQGRRYPLRSVVVISLMAVVCGCDDAEAMEAWGRANESWLEGFLSLPHGAPTQDVFLSVFAALDPKAFEAVLRSWAALLRSRLVAMGKHIAVDGKTSRRSFDRAADQGPLHTVTAFLSGSGLVLGATKTERKSNEITAIPELLRLIDLRGATVTIDAMGCQTEIAQTIVEGGGNYLLAVKENQPTLHQEVVETFTEAADGRKRTIDEQPRPQVETFEEVEKGHGRIETRNTILCRDLAWVSTADRWKAIAFIAVVLRERTVLATGTTSTERAYYIGSDPTADVQQVAKGIRQHWAIENGLHWVMDLGFREDEARHRAGNAAQNMTTLRHFALNIINQDKTRKLGVANSRKRAGWDRGYLLDLLKGAAV
jgi:predicted transposase YbfD/YdcC